MSRYRTRTRQELLERMVARVVARSSLTDLHDTASGKQALAAPAVELEDISDQAALILRAVDPNRAEREELDRICAVLAPLGFQGRRGATRAVGQVRLYRNSGAGASEVPAFSRFGAPASGGVGADEAVEITGPATIPAGAPPVSLLAAARAVKAGSAGNVAAGTVTKILTAVPGLDAVGNDAAFTGGEDEETDAELRSRLWEYLWSLCRTTPRALQFLARTIGVAAHADGVQGAAVQVFLDETPVVRRCLFARIVADPVFPGVSTLYIDDGQGFAGVSAAQLYKTVANSVLVAAAAGGERRIRLPWWPVVVGTAFTLEKNTGAWATLVEGTDYTVNRANGQIVLAVALAAGNGLRVSYTYHLDLVRAVQYAVEGDDADPLTWPGWVAAGGICFVRAALSSYIPITADLTFDPALTDWATLEAAVKAELLAYTAALDIGADWVRAAAIARAMGVVGMTNIALTLPASDVPVAEYRKAATTSGLITLT